jgi:glyoxylase-like metal-dependent hydrolase (beta-lactamase superfamily II)
MKKIAVLVACLAVSCSPVKDASPGEPLSEAVQNIRIYALDCGRIEIDLSRFAQGDEYAGRTMNLVVGVFLIRHPQGDLMWDAGLPDAFNDPENEEAKNRPDMSVPFTLASQLEALDLAVEDIEYLSLSHSHFDHLGNANLFADSTFLVDKDERTHMFRDEARSNANTFGAYSALEESETIQFDGDYDVFGDGTVMILAMPGHTPGHTVLQVKLPQTGPVLLSGDLYHLKEARERRTVPKFNTNVEDTLSSMDRFEKIAADLGARVIVQHSMEDFQTLPKLPGYLE